MQTNHVETVIPTRLKTQLNRWYPLDPVPLQLKLVKDEARFVIVAAGRRSGKTERAKRKLVKAAMAEPDGLYFIAAPTYAQVKKIYWDDMKKLCLTDMCAKQPSASELIIYLDNGSQIHLIGLDKPTRIEGIPWDGGIIDEAAYIKPEAFITSIRPSLDTKDPSKPNKKAWCWIIGKPNGLNHFYDWYRYAVDSNDPEWSAYTWKSSEVLDQSTMDAAKRSMPLKLYRQEYEASFETVEGRIYDDYSVDNQCNIELQPHEDIHYFCDFNFTPMSHGLAVVREHHCDIVTRKVITAPYIFDDIILESAVGQDNIKEFCERYENHFNKRIYLYGDRNGRNGEKHGKDSEYITMTNYLQEKGWQVFQRVPLSNPSIKDSQNAVRAKIRNGMGEVSFFVDPVKAKWIHTALSTVQVKKGSTYVEDDKDKYQHITTAIRYFINYLYALDSDIIEMSEYIITDEGI